MALPYASETCLDPDLLRLYFEQCVFLDKGVFFKPVFVASRDAMREPLPLASEKKILGTIACGAVLS